MSGSETVWSDAHAPRVLRRSLPLAPILLFGLALSLKAFVVVRQWFSHRIRPECYDRVIGRELEPMRHDQETTR